MNTKYPESKYEGSVDRALACIKACAGIDNPEEAIAKVREALGMCLKSFKLRNVTHVLSLEEQSASIATINAIAAIAPKP